jgi:hypothetical protein
VIVPPVVLAVIGVPIVAAVGRVDEEIDEFSDDDRAEDDAPERHR